MTNKYNHKIAHNKLLKRIKTGLNAGNVAWWIMELPSGKVYFDNLKVEFLGYSPDHFTHYQDFTKLLHPDDHQKVMQAMDDHLAGKKDHYEVEYRIKSQNNGYIWFRDSGGIFEQDEESEQIQIVGIVQNITKHKEKEKKTEHLNRVLHTIRNINQLIDKEKNESRLIKKTSNLLTKRGYQSAWIGLTERNNQLIDFASSGFDQKSDQTLSEIVASNQKTCLDVALKSSDVVVMNEKSAGCSKCPLHDIFSNNIIMSTKIEHNQKIYGVLSLYLPRTLNADRREKQLVKEIAHDLGLALYHIKLEKERARNNEKIEQERNRLLAMFDGIEESIYVADPETYELLHVNKAFKQNWGKDAIGEKCYKVLQGRDTPCPFCTNDKIFGENLGKTYKWEFKNEVNGRWYRCTDKAIKWTDGRMVRFELASDITNRKRAEEKLMQLNQKLEQSNKELEQFAYVASHDLQEPLRMISSFTKLFERRYKDLVDQDGREFIEYIVEGAERMQNLIEELLKFSRIQTRGKPFEKIDIASVIEQVKKNLQMYIEESDASLIYDNLPRIKCDKSQMILLFQNLIQNAIKFRSDKSPEIKIDAEENENYWKFKVEDNGIGIKEEYLNKIFRIFQRLHSRKEYQGTGTGLALCKRIVERHGGKIWVESKPDQGSQFYFTITKRSVENEQ